MRLSCGVGLLALALLSSGAAGAADLSLSLEGGAEYDSNVRRRPTNPENDVLFQLIPGVRIYQERSHDLNFDINYIPRFEFAVKNGKELNDIDQLLDAEILYSATGRLDFFLRDEFAYLRSTLRSRQTLDSTAIPIISTGRDRVTLNQLEGGATYQLTPRLYSSLQLSYRLFDTTRVDRADARRIATRLDVLYRLSRRQRLGFGFSYGRDEFDETPLVVGSETDGVVGFARWRYEVTNRISIDMRAGPAFYHSIQDEPTPVTTLRVPSTDDSTDPDSALVFGVPSCNLNPLPPPDRVFVGCSTLRSLPRAQIESFGTVQLATVPGLGDASQNNIDAIVSVDIARQWSEELRTTARYGRTPGVASGVGGTVIRDAVTLAADWAFAPSWQFFARGDWVLRQSLSNSLGIFRTVDDVPNPGGADPNLADVAQFQGEQFRAPTDRTEVKTQNWSALVRLSYRFRTHTTAFLQGTYDKQDSLGGTLASGDDFTDWIVSVGVVYTFDPLGLGF